MEMAEMLRSKAGFASAGAMPDGRLEKNKIMPRMIAVEEAQEAEARVGIGLAGPAVRHQRALVPRDAARRQGRGKAQFRNGAIEGIRGELGVRNRDSQ
jgi:hypothetical protein